jgi:UDP-2,4-diacetamido-2,4,6-trideoxy-beta-L-altropyranose hydrolase
MKRCLSIAHALKDFGANITFVARDLGVDIRALTLAEGFDCQILPAPQSSYDGAEELVAHAIWAGVSWLQDVEQTFEALASEPIDMLLVDHYAFDNRWHERARQLIECRVAAIDDLADRPLDVDLVVDHNFAIDHQAKYAGLLKPGTRILGGPRFALLGPCYVSAPKYSPRNNVESIGISMGGVDAANLSVLALTACRHEAEFRGPIEVATTRNNPNLEILRKVATQDSAAVVTLDQPDLAPFFARHDMQIGAGGGSTWERCCIGVPTLAVIAAENQRQVLFPLDDMKVLRAVREVPPSARTIGNELRSMISNFSVRSSLASTARRLVDGLGAKRVATCLLELCCG